MTADQRRRRKQQRAVAKLAMADDFATWCDRETMYDEYTLTGTHAALLALLRRRVSETVACEIMGEIAEAGGLMGM